MSGYRDVGQSLFQSRLQALPEATPYNHMRELKVRGVTSRRGRIHLPRFSSSLSSSSPSHTSTHMEEALPDDLLADVPEPDGPLSSRVLTVPLDQEGGEDDDGHEALYDEGSRSEESTRLLVDRRYR